MSFLNTSFSPGGGKGDMSIAIAVSFPLLIEAHMPTLLPPPVPQGIRGLMISTNRDHYTGNSYMKNLLASSNLEITEHIESVSVIFPFSSGNL